MKHVFCFLFIIIFSSVILKAQSRENKGSVLCSQKKMNSSLVKLDEFLLIGQHSYDMLNYNLNLNIYSCFITPYPKNFSATEILTLQADSTINSITLNAIN